MYLFKYHTNFALSSVVSRLSSDGRSVYTQWHGRIFIFSHKLPCHLCFASCQWVFVLFAIVPVHPISGKRSLDCACTANISFYLGAEPRKPDRSFLQSFFFSHNHVCYFLADTKPANERRLLYFLIRVVERRLQRRFEARDRVCYSLKST